MSIESVSEKESLNTFEVYPTKESTWDSRTVSMGTPAESLPLAAKVFGLHSHLYPKVCSFRDGKTSVFGGYFDSEEKKQNKFDIALYQHHIRCNSEESKKHLEKSFEMMATGMVGVVVGAVSFIGNPKTGAWMIYVCSERIWKGVEEFKKSMETSNTPLESVHFVNWYDDYERNTEELTKNSILEPWKPLDASGFEIMDDQYKRKQLDPSLSNNIRDYV